MNTQPIYLDHSATTPVDPRVVEAMLPFFTEKFGNASSLHRWGQVALSTLDQARQTIADILGASPKEIIFTSGGSESDNLALRGVALARREKMGANRLLVAAGEHHAVSHTAEQLIRLFGFEVDWLPLQPDGRVNPDDAARLLSAQTALVSVMYANNEIGSINPIAAIGAHCRGAGVPFHTDAVQAAAHLPIGVNELCVDLVSLGAHKFYGPKGVGALYVRKGTPLFPGQTGGSQEFGLRAGTQNVPFIVGMAEALRLTALEREARCARFLPLRNRLIGSILENIPGAFLTGSLPERLPNHASFVFEDVDGNTLLRMLDVEGFACSSGSACKSGDPKPSGVLLALGLPPEMALGSLRVTLGAATTPEEIEFFIERLPMLVARARSLRTP
jgi:cysteine desulfurase